MAATAPEDLTPAAEKFFGELVELAQEQYEVAQADLEMIAMAARCKMLATQAAEMAARAFEEKDNPGWHRAHAAMLRADAAFRSAMQALKLTPQFRSSKKGKQGAAEKEIEGEWGDLLE